MASKISKEVSAIQRGIGDKIGNICMAYASVVTGFAVAFYNGWLLTLILLATFPFLMLIGVGMAAGMSDGVVTVMKAYA